MTNNKLIKMAKAQAIAKYTSSEHNSHQDYDDFMELKTDNDLINSMFIIWEPFETYGLDDLQDYMEGEFSTTLTLLKSVFQQSVKGYQVDPDDFVDVETFHNFVAGTNGTLHRQGANDEYAVILTVDAEDVL